ncbi:conserved hypothetical protein [Trichinella spiralis]|uniref:hypothetical protein n=1 Tax=Trichinella spiralis TaxID=6334 RepID=UPI0001EFD4D3|nr:conserved hypothetical protein [Trichinella spiralis]
MPKCEATHRHANIEVAVAGEQAQFSFDVVFSAVVALRRSCVYADVDRFQRKQQVVVFWRLIWLCIRLVEKRSKVVLSVEQRSTAINMKKIQLTMQQFQMKKR